MRICIIYDSMRENGATSSIVECIASTLRNYNVYVDVCKPNRSCPDPRSFDLVIIGTPIYYERPMKSIIEFIDKNSGLRDCRVVVFITCFAASRKIPGPIRSVVIKRYLNSVLKHIRGCVVASKVFKGWLHKPDKGVLEECIEWCRDLKEIIKD